jgi:hypothetical protein
VVAEHRCVPGPIPPRAQLDERAVTR